MGRLLLLIILLAPASAFAARPPRSEEEEFLSLEKASLEEALNIRTSVATKNAIPLRETPGLVTVITREEIQSSGARDLVDVLRYIPEFEFGVDVQGNLGLGVRGNWANEGKVLLLWNGQYYNETLYATIQFDRFPVDQIEEIEIIKGPGSVIYGGNAELAVINIRTRSATHLTGSSAFAAYGQGEKARARNYAGYSYAGDFGGMRLAGDAFWDEAQRSDRRYTDFSGASYGMNGASGLTSKSVALSAERGNMHARFILDDYSLRSRDDIDGTVLSSGSARIRFPSIFAETGYIIYLPGLVRLEPKLNYARSLAWQEKNPAFPYDKRTERATASLTAFYKPAAGTDLMAGGEYYHDSVRVDSLTALKAMYPGGGDKAAYDNAALFGQGSFDLDFANLTAGARYDKHSQYGASLVPRLAATKLIGDFNFKVIYSQAFKAPSIENIRLNSGIKPEKTFSQELEAGYKVSETLYFSGNLFSTVIKDPIIYGVAGASETYSNADRTGTRGFGLSSKYKSGRVRADLDYLCYAASGNRVAEFSVPGHGSSLLAFPRHKLTVTASLPLAEGLSVNPAAVYQSRRFAYSGSGALKAFPEIVTADVNFQLKDRPLNNLTLNLGIKDIFKSGYSYLQPYAGGHAPLPAPSREIFLKAVYDF